MRTRFLTGALRKMKQTGLILGGLGMLLTAPAYAEGPLGIAPITQVSATDNMYNYSNTSYVGMMSEGCAPAPSCGCNDGCNGGCNSCDDGCGCCNLGEPWTLMSCLCDDPCKEPCFNIGGWTQWGYTNRSDNTMNTHPHRFNNHQSWMYIERIADGSNGWDYGFRGDLMYGVDAQNTQAFGNSPGSWDFQNGWDHGIYGWAAPQLYGQVAYGKLSVKAGHFYTNQGYEVFTAPGNFFYSHAFTWNFNEPFTHTGVMGMYQLNDNTSVHAGWTAGWDTAFEQRDDGSNFHGGFSTKLTDRHTLIYHTCAGDFGWRGEGYMHSVILDTAINDKWQYVIHNDYTNTNLTGDNNYAFVNYLFYTVNDCMKLGGRFEWWKASDFSIYEITGGVNYKLHANLIVRPEIRYQWASDDTQAANNFGITTEEQAIFGCDAIFTF